MHDETNHETDEAIERRALLGRLAAAGCLGTVDPSGLLRALGARPRRRVDFFDTLPGRRIQCHVCPLECFLEDGQTCWCRTRTNRGGVLYTDAYENPVILRLDPIEKLPLHHYAPGTKSLSLAVSGCNLRCEYCQNWAQAGKRPAETRNKELPVGSAGPALRKAGIRTLALAYTEPASFLEYAEDLGCALSDQGLDMVAATAAYLNPPAMRRLASVCKAMVLALKSFRESFYKRICGVHLAPVLKAIETAKDCGVWIELTHLIVPTLNDSEAEIRDLARWVARNLGPETPLHVARFVPAHKLRNLPRTPLPTLERARAIARAQGLKHVYVSNVAPHPGNHSYCAGCGHLLIRRMGFKVLANELVDGRCPKCRRPFPGVRL